MEYGQWLGVLAGRNVRSSASVGSKVVQRVSRVVQRSFKAVALRQVNREDNQREAQDVFKEARQGDYRRNEEQKRTTQSKFSVGVLGRPIFYLTSAALSHLLTTQIELWTFWLQG